MAKHQKCKDVHTREIAAAFGGAFRMTTQTPTPDGQSKPGWLKSTIKWIVGTALSGGMMITVWVVVIPADTTPVPRSVPEVIWC